MNDLSFHLIERNEGRGRAIEVLPLVDSRSLVDLVTAFERQHGWTSACGYSGLIPRYYNFGSLDCHFMGYSLWEYPARPRSLPTTLLVCGDCGLGSCWPLMAEIFSDECEVVWRRFAQPHRPQWDYSEFGPFVFDREEYEVSLRRLMDHMAMLA